MEWWSVRVTVEEGRREIVFPVENLKGDERVGRRRRLGVGGGGGGSSGDVCMNDVPCFRQVGQEHLAVREELGECNAHDTTTTT